MAKVILVVDDDEDQRTIIRMILDAAFPVRVVEAADGEAALRVAKKRRPDLILLDLCLPGLTGREVAERLKTDPRTRHIQILAMSGSAKWNEAAESGFADFLVKPFSPVTLLAKIRRYLEERDG